MYTRRNQPKEKDNNDNQPNFNISDTLLIYSVRNRNQQMIDLIINHPTFNKKKSRLNEAVIIAIGYNNFQNFKKLIHLVDTNFNNNTYQDKKIFSFINFRMNKRPFGSNLNNTNTNNINQQKYISNKNTFQRKKFYVIGKNF